MLLYPLLVLIRGVVGLLAVEEFLAARDSEDKQGKINLYIVSAITAMVAVYITLASCF